MITADNFKKVLKALKFKSSEDEQFFEKTFSHFEGSLSVDFEHENLIYPNEIKGRDRNTSFAAQENFVVFECVNRLLDKGYRPEHIELEKEWHLGHNAKSGRADICISDANGSMLFIIECKTCREFEDAWADTREDGAQLFSYFQQERAAKFLCLYTADIDEVIKPSYYLINVQDNKEKLANDESAKSYKEATNNKELYRVWHETYHNDYATRGLFEEEIEPYQIGKNKYTTNDLKPVDNDTIQKKYNEFALILRQHNVGGHENAFDKLVNLFLAKVVDETNNPNDLNFYWKGSSYDDYYRLQDRLQRLYRDGMKRFLNEDVTYIENSKIEKAFRRFKNDPDSTKKTIMGYFRELKFFSDNDFSFISVHNKRLFEENAAILLKVVKMLQDIKLKDSEQNQLLGDLFEGFLNKGVKQSEGQFFTPMPIVRFLVSSLPLEQIIKDSEEIPNVIDYACGAGHFLTEYAVQIKEYTKQFRPTIPLKDYYAHITGIEKEYRLSKVSKVSAFMYGHDDIKIIYADALVPDAKLNENSYDVLIANPPYSVKGFLETLTESQRKHYALFNADINVGKNNAIETFFIERAAQLLKAGGIAGIILPVSVLNKDGIYVQAREIILQKFDIIALVKFGSGTFGKTGTNTVMMFLRRKETNTPDSEHYRNRVESWFKQHHEGDETYEDKEELLTAYCEHCGYDLDEYMNFLSGSISESFKQNRIVRAYMNSFLAAQSDAMRGVCDKAKDIRNKFKNKQKTKEYKKSSETKKKKEEQEAFMQFVTEIEKEKVYYFILAKTVFNPVIIVESPSETANIQRFLGYKWSDTKGNEGIKYLNVVAQNLPDDEGNAEDDDTIIQIRGIDGIQTPLFNPTNIRDNNKINTLIQKNYNGEQFTIPEELNKFVYKNSLVDMIEFKETSFKKDFNFKKEFNNSTSNGIKQFSEKFPSEALKDLLVKIKGKKTKIQKDNIQEKGKYPVITQESNKLISGYTDNTNCIDDVPVIVFGDHSCTIKYIDFPFIRGADGTQLLKTDEQVILLKYLYYYLQSVDIENKGKYERHYKYLKKVQVPLLPILTQQKIVRECGNIDVNYDSLNKQIIQVNESMKSLMERAQRKSHNELNLNNADLFEIKIGSRVKKDEIVENGEFDVYSANVFEPFGKTAHSVLKDFTKPSVLWGIDGDWMVNYQEAGKKFNPTDHCGVIRVLNETVVNPRYLVYPLLKAGEAAHFTRAYRASTERVKALTLKVPDIKIQNSVVGQLFEYERQIADKKSEMQGCIIKKQEILEKYLK